MSPACKRVWIVLPGLAAGWSVFDDDFEFLTRRGSTAESYALSWPYKPNSFGWASDIPRNGIAVTVLLIRRAPGRDKTVNLCHDTPHLAHSPKVRRFPLEIPKTTTHRLEGAPNVLEYRVLGRMGEQYNVELRVAINSLRPTLALLRRAQLVVDNIRFPKWPRLLRCQRLELEAVSELPALLSPLRSDKQVVDDLRESAFRRHCAQIYRYVRRRSATHEDAEDLAQMVFAEAAARLDQFKPSDAPVLA